MYSDSHAVINEFGLCLSVTWPVYYRYVYVDERVYIYIYIYIYTLLFILILKVIKMMVQIQVPPKYGRLRFRKTEGEMITNRQLLT